MVSPPLDRHTHTFGDESPVGCQGRAVCHLYCSPHYLKYSSSPLAVVVLVVVVGRPNFANSISAQHPPAVEYKKCFAFRLSGKAWVEREE